MKLFTEQDGNSGGLGERKRAEEEEEEEEKRRGTKDWKSQLGTIELFVCI